MSRMAHWFSVGAVSAIVFCVPATSAAQGQVPNHVRVLTASEQIMRWLGPQKDVILVVNQGTVLEVLDFDRDEASYWVILPPDLHGTRKVGWIRASAVEPAVPAPPSDATPASDPAPVTAPSEVRSDSAQALALAARSAANDEKVSISVRRDAPPASSSDVAPANTSYAFQDVHFDRDHFSIRSEDIDRLRVAAAALKDDPSLVVTIEGHTCSLGSGPYNLALGNRRATAVKDYLVSAGVPAERLITVSQGEKDAAHDNSHEETRRLNRRVALVPKIPR